MFVGTRRGLRRFCSGNEESYTDGRRYWDRVFGQFKLSRPPVDSMHDDGVGVLLRSEKELAGRINDEVSWGTTAGRMVPERCKKAGVGMNREHGNAIMAAVGAE